MPIFRAALVAGLLAPAAAALLSLAGRPEPAGPLVGVLAGLLLRGSPAAAALATLWGGAWAVLTTEPAGIETADAMGSWLEWPGWPGWALGAVLAYAPAARHRPASARHESGEARQGPGEAPPSRLPAVAVAAGAGAVLAAGQLAAAQAAGLTLWEDYHPYDGPGWYRDLTSALWYPAASVVLATVLAGRLRGGRQSSAAVPVAAWLGAALAGGPMQYAQALGVTVEPPGVALLASLAGGGIGAAAGVLALRHPGVAAGLVCFVAFRTLQALDRAPGELPEPVEVIADPLLLVTPFVIVAVIAARTARRAARRGPGLVAGLAGPLLIWSVYAAVGARAYDHSTQSGPYAQALLTAFLAPAVALAAAQIAVLTGRSGSSDDATSHGTSTRRSP
ncbi:hypothetical protein AB0K40_33475 [Nonomuraea bangladeshensis]|uniref:Uncharacterized protein n=1 Tax=Nonomuraea bangladeshensis TaxID=404385 RepID=A0ABV3HD33_9ACTN